MSDARGTAAAGSRGGGGGGVGGGGGSSGSFGTWIGAWLGRQTRTEGCADLQSTSTATSSAPPHEAQSPENARPVCSSSDLLLGSVSPPACKNTCTCACA